MRQIAFDTSTKFLSIALMEGAKVVSSMHEDVGIKHSEILVPCIKDILASSGWNIRDVELVSVGLGPGSFTGLRIAISTAKGLAAAIGIKIAGVSSMDAIAMNAPSGKKKIMPFLDARKEKVYTALYERKNTASTRVTGYLLAKAEDVLRTVDKDVFIYGDAVEKYRDILDSNGIKDVSPDADWYPKAIHIGEMGAAKAAAGEFDPPEDVDPMYLHAKECNITLKKGE
ncbi:MAG: tRNA (adenosine(37)-N6)-threonylcarbamoyltransferase complex dimerization subunit type 1 TsaB [Candidatus Omnitrophica bacterium]|nr:tRNA (adenosine(37)-N6)-threonylcarbamoyltransferase complex dimerization subunit type 1 TsaB [Candidatus Omnitrophota bacterium]MDD5487635.1 tRNA (adenosine(37)-N6)-threonylcarbamoyltransferase complex dimerization subunit type 1 TsaB [Candidatus Omnitrophota bacterium]